MKFNRKHNVKKVNVKGIKDLKEMLKNKKVLRVIKTVTLTVVVCICCVIVISNQVNIPVNAAEFSVVEEVIKEGASFDFIDTAKNAAQFFFIR